VGLSAFASLRRATLARLIASWVILQFLPPVALTTAILQLAPVSVGPCILLGLPKSTLRVKIVVNMGWSPVVLPIMRVHTLISLVLLVAKRTPHCLEVKQVEVSVTLHSLQ